MQTDIGVRIRKMREAQDLSPEDVCRMAGLSPDRLAAFEEGREVPSIGVVIKLSRVLGSKVGGLLHGGGFASEELTVSRASEARPGFEQGETEQGYTYRCLTRPGTPGHDMEPFLLTFALGGWLALLEAHRRPARVGRVVLVNGAALSGDGSEAQVNLLPRTRAEARAAIEAVTSPHSPPVADFVLDDLVRRAAGSPLARLLASDWQASSLDGRLGEIATPVLLLWGEDDRVLPLAYAERVAAQLQAARLEPLGRCGHIPMRDCPEILTPLLLEAIDGPAPAATAPPAIDRPEAGPSPSGGDRVGGR